MDIIAKITDSLAGFAAGLSNETIQFWLRLVCLLILPAAICAWSFRQGYRSVFVQVLAAVFGLLLALSLPLEHLRIGSGMVRLWLLTFAVVLAAFMPAILPALTVRTLKAQRQLRAALYLAVGVLILANLIWSSP